MHNAFLAIAIIISSKNFKILEIKDLKNSEVGQTIESENTIPDIMDKDFMSEKEGETISKILGDIEDFEIVGGELANLDVESDNDFAELIVETTPKKTEKVGEVEEVAKITDSVTPQNEKETKIAKISNVDIPLETQKVVKIEDSKIIVKKESPMIVVEKETKLPESNKIKSNKDKLQKAVIVIEEKKVPIESNQVKEATKEVAQVKKVEIPKETTKSFEKVKTVNKQDKQNSLKTEKSKIEKIADTKKGYTEDTEFKAYLTAEEIMDLKLNEEEKKSDIPLIRPRKKIRHTFINKDVPPELISEKRSYDNRHVPVIMNNEDIQNMAKEAINNNDLEKLRAIVEEFKNPDLSLNDYKTILNYATSLKRHRIMTYLIYNGADINLYSPVFASIENGDIKGLRILLERNVNINIKDSFHKTLLMIAIEKRNNKIALLLIKYGADGSATNRKGENSIDIARRFKMIEVEAELLRLNK